ncbi:hypothetical protein [Brevundimonas subvibrioides]|uniref:O-antigen polymerase n=1 Tax=Brevundimonas subvibrioides (strain ATCC 15264 / DSM 4735 / LMG 14903 / NBRC 16000 / CB 81) TaxID=633149 RepID=D9QP21_BRESC|nr:hypothetical protein [Brevundimonas subvibrioides]ADL00454.1 O-antigen polymerase [Brevundimonas subvibrioides ATCC 15264]
MSARQIYRFRLAGAVVLATATLVVAGAFAVSLSSPNESLADRIPLVAVSEGRAEAAAEVQPPSLDKVRAETLKTLRQKPGDAAAWGRLAWIADRQGRVADALVALDRTYVVAPYGPDITAWRLRFAYGRWAALTPDLRRQATAELRVAIRDRPGVVYAAEREITDPAGRLAFALTRQAVIAEPDK